MFRNSLQRNTAFQNLAFVVNGPPKVTGFAIYLHENFVKAPSPVEIAYRREALK